MEDWNETERNVVAEEVEDSGEGEVQQVAHQEQEDVPEEERVTIRLKFLNETQKEVEASLVENLGQFKRRNFTEEIPPTSDAAKFHISRAFFQAYQWLYA